MFLYITHNLDFASSRINSQIIRIVAEKRDKSEIEQIISEVQDKTFEFLTNKIEEQALLFTKQKSQNYIVKKINETKLSELISVDNAHVR